MHKTEHKRAISSSIVTVIMCIVAIILAAYVSNSSILTIRANPEESIAPTIEASPESTEIPTEIPTEETNSPEGTSSPEMTSPSETGGTGETNAPIDTTAPTITPVPTPSIPPVRTAVRTAPATNASPYLPDITPPKFSPDHTFVPLVSGGTEPTETPTVEASSPVETEPVVTPTEFVNIDEANAAVKTSDIIRFVCVAIYVIGGLVILFAIVRIVFILVKHRDFMDR